MEPLPWNLIHYPHAFDIYFWILLLGAEVTLDSALVTGTTDITKYQYMNNLVETLGTSHLGKNFFSGYK